jgi:ceramide glucosyltransferase
LSYCVEPYRSLDTTGAKRKPLICNSYCPKPLLFYTLSPISSSLRDREVAGVPEFESGFVPIAGLVLGLAALVQAALLLIWTYEATRFIRSRCRSPLPTGYTPRVHLFMPCKGVEPDFDDTIDAVLSQDYPDYGVTFVVESMDDPAYGRLRQLIGGRARLVVAGEARDCGQKVHNLLVATGRLADAVDVLAFADSDAVPDRHWLRRLVYPLNDDRTGVITGYRWFVPEVDNWPGIILAALNAPVTMLLGNHQWNEVWGGSWAIRRSVFEDAIRDGVWRGAVTEDSPISRLMRVVRLRVAYEPTCLVASPVQCSWRWLLSFGRRQYLITRVYAPNVWWSGLALTALAQLAFWGGIAALILGQSVAWPAVLVASLYGLNTARAMLRQRAAAQRFPLTPGQRRAAWLDMLAHPLLTLGHLLFMLSSIGSVTTWRGIRYRLLGPHQTEILSRPPAVGRERRAAA